VRSFVAISQNAAGPTLEARKIRADRGMSTINESAVTVTPSDKPNPGITLESRNRRENTLWKEDGSDGGVKGCFVRGSDVASKATETSEGIEPAFERWALDPSFMPPLSITLNSLSTIVQ
jgi:hypothetical protein